MAMNTVIHGKDASGNPEHIEVSNGAAKVTQAGGTWDYGTWPEDRYDTASQTNSDGALDAIFATNTTHSGYAGLIFINTANNVTLQITLDGSTWIAADHPFIDMGVAARTIVTGTNGNVGPFLMNTPCKGFRFLNEAAAAGAVTYAQVGKVHI